jgi:DNA invertase Pin-like site-specific DNA recombinase
MNASTPRRGAILRRVSTDEQEDNFSLDNQQQACRALAQQQGIEIVADVCDVHSGYSLKRPGLSHVRELAAARDIDVLIVWKLDRLSRRITHWGKLLGELEDAHVSITSVMEPWLDTATPIGKHMIMTLVFVAEQERQNFMDRSAAGMRNRAASGLPFGGYAPYGYTAVVAPVKGRASSEVVRVALVLDPLTAPRVVWIFERAADGWSTRRIAKELTAQGVPTPRHATPRTASGTAARSRASSTTSPATGASHQRSAGSKAKKGTRTTSARRVNGCRSRQSASHRSCHASWPRSRMRAWRRITRAPSVACMTRVRFSCAAASCAVGPVAAR